MSYKLVPSKDEDLLKRSYGQVTNHYDFFLSRKTKHPIKHGLFDGNIFGSIGKCSCGRNKTIGKTCPICGDSVVDYRGATIRIGHYMLNYPIISKYKIRILASKLVKVHPIFKCYQHQVKNDLLLSFYNTRIQYTAVDDSEVTEESIKMHLYVKDDLSTYRISLIPYSPDDEGKVDVEDFGPNGLKILCNRYKLHEMHSTSIEFLKDYLNQCFVILPTTDRPVFFRPGTSSPDFDKFNTYYRAIIANNALLPTLLGLKDISISDKLAILISLNRGMDWLYDQYGIVATSKQNYIRNKLTMRVLESGRANIIGAPDLRVNEVYLPESLVYEAAKAYIIEEFHKHPEIKHPISEYKNPSQESIKIFHKLVEGWGCLMLRNPTIQKYNISPFRIKLWDKIAIGLPLLSTALFNADFDGDQMAFYLIPSKDRINNYINLMGSGNYWEFEKNNESLFQPEGAILDGLYIATRYEPNNENGNYGVYSDFKDIQNDYTRDTPNLDIDTIVRFKNDLTTYGRLKVEEILGFKLNDVIGENEPINAKNIGKIMSALNEKIDRVDRLRELQIFALETVTYEGNTTISLADIFHTTPDAVEFDEILQSSEPDTIKFRKLNAIRNQVVKEKIDQLDNENLKNILHGSGKLKASSISALLGCRFELDINKTLHYYDSTLSRGYDEEAMVSHTIENRQILIEKQKLVPAGGYFSRQLIDILYDIVFTEKPSESIVGAILPEHLTAGRKILGEEGTDERGEKLFRVASCIDGDSESISREELSQTKSVFQRYRVNSPIGISLGQSFAEPSIQASLGLKHGGSLVKPSQLMAKSITPGKVTNITTRILTVQNEDKTYRYLIPNNALLTQEAKSQEEFKAGTILFYVDKMVHVEARLVSLFRLIDAYIAASDNAVGPKDIITSVCYAPCEGTIHYDLPAQTVTIGNFTCKMNFDILYYYPEGYEIKKGQRFASDLVDLAAYQKEVQDLGWTFHVFRDQMNEILGGSSLNVELYEAIFKVICHNNFSIRISHKNMGKLFNEINLSHAKRAIESALARDDIGDGLLTQILTDDF